MNKIAITFYNFCNVVNPFLTLDLQNIKIVRFVYYYTK